MPPEAGGLPPEAHDNEDGAERQELSRLDADVEGHQIADHAVGRQVEVLQLGRQAETVEQAEDRLSACESAGRAQKHAEDLLKSVAPAGIEQLVDEQSESESELEKARSQLQATPEPDQKENLPALEEAEANHPLMNCLSVPIWPVVYMSSIYGTSTHAHFG